MAASFEQALEIAKAKYPHQINYFEEYADYFVFGYDDGNEYDGGDYSPIVIRKSDSMALNYAPIFFNMDAGADGPGEMISEGEL